MVLIADAVAVFHCSDIVAIDTEYVYILPILHQHPIQYLHPHSDFWGT